MKIITQYKSHSGQTKMNHVILNDNNVSPKSYASLLLLNEALKELDVDYMKSKLDLDIYLNNRYIFLEKSLNEKGDLICHYCGKKLLEIGFKDAKLAYLNNKNKNLATIDHIIPVCSGLINLLNEDNWCIACKKCNSRKGNMSYFDFINKFKRIN